MLLQLQHVQIKTVLTINTTLIVDVRGFFDGEGRVVRKQPNRITRPSRDLNTKRAGVSHSGFYYIFNNLQKQQPLKA